MNSLPKTVTRQRRGGCDLNPGPTVPESRTLTTRLPSQLSVRLVAQTRSSRARKGEEAECALVRRRAYSSVA